MNAIISYPQKKEELLALKAFLKALKIKFVDRADVSPYNAEFVAKIEKSKQQAKNGKSRSITLDEIWKSE